MAKPDPRIIDAEFTVVDGERHAPTRRERIADATGKAVELALFIPAMIALTVGTRLFWSWAHPLLWKALFGH